MHKSFEDFKEYCDAKGVEVIGNPSEFDKVSIDIRGKGNTIYLSKGVKLKGASIVFYSDQSSISIGEGSKLTGNVKIGYLSHLKIGANLTITGGLSVAVSDQTTVTIGDDCMFGVDVGIYSHDYHPVFDLESGSRLNKSRNISIGNHVWLANETRIVKGARIGDGSVIGLGCIYGSECPENSICMGNPGKVVKEGIVWDRASLNTSHPKGVRNILEL